VFLWKLVFFGIIIKGEQRNGFGNSPDIQALLLLPMALQPGVILGLLQEFPSSFPISDGYCPISTP